MSERNAIVVEDQDDLAQLYQAALVDAGFSVTISQRGDLGLEQIRAIRPSLVVLDIHLPGIMGTKILQEIRSDENLEDTKVIMLSADDRRAEDVRDLANLVLLKPVTYSQLKDLARRIVPDEK